MTSRAQPMVSVSGGKDSTATLILAVQRGVEPMALFCDTGNEHDAVYEYLDYLEGVTGVEIKRLRADFSDQWWRRRDYVRDVWPVGTARHPAVPQSIVDRALAILDGGPTGNPFLDLCIVKNRFPASRSQFCTDELKKRPAMIHTAEVIAHAGPVCSWQGVRADESRNRRHLPSFDRVSDEYSIYRPILAWTAADVFAYHRRMGVAPNPLYKMGMDRVGCMPCINVRKDALSEIARRFPEHIDRISEWERIVSQVSKRESATFFRVGGDNDTAYERGNVSVRVAWSATSRGGKQLDLLKAADPEPCASSYGLCE